MATFAKETETRSRRNVEIKKGELIHRTVAVIATVFFVFSGIPVPTSFALGNQPVSLNESNQPVPTVTLDQANAASPATDAPIPSGAPIPTDNPLTRVTSNAAPEDVEFRNVIYILPWTQSERREDIDSFMALLASKGITSITRDQVEALRPAQTDKMHILWGAYHLAQKGSQIAVAFSATLEYGFTEVTTYSSGSTITHWRPVSRNDLTNILYSASPENDPVLINKSAQFTNMGFTEDGLLAVGLIHDASAAYNSKGETVMRSYYVLDHNWKPAASNVDFAFKIEFVPNSADPQRVLILRDCYFGKEYEIAREHIADGHDISDVYDVSPDGEFVIYETSGGYNLYDPEMPLGRRCTVYLQSITNPSQRIELGDYIRYGDQLSLTAVQFEGDVVRITRENHLGVTTIMEVNLKTGVVQPGVPTGWTRAESNANFAFREVQIGSQVALNLMDLVNNSVIEVGRIDVGGAYPAHFDSYDVLLDGTAVIWGSTRVPYGSSTYLRKLDGSTELSPELILAGRVTASDYDASTQILKLSLENTSLNNPSWNTRTVFVNIATMTETVPPVPTGWTRAASNVNFAFRLKRVGSVERLYVMDLKTGVRKTLCSVATRTMRVTDTYDVSPDGTTVIYGTHSRSGNKGFTYVRRISGTSKRLVLPGTLRSVSYESNGGIAVLIMQKNYSSSLVMAQVDLLKLALRGGLKIVSSTSASDRLKNKKKP